MIKTKFPWQSLPANLIAYGSHHCTLDSEFEQEVGYLLLDVGVETTLNVLRTLPDKVARVREIEKALLKSPQGQKGDEFQVKITDIVNLQKTTFHFLVRIARELVKDGMEESDWKKLEYFHSIRNKLYHQGDGVTTTKANTRDYADLAIKLLRVVLSVDLHPESWIDQETPERNDGVDIVVADMVLGVFTFKEMAQKLSVLLDDLADKLSVIVEVSRPKYTSRRFLAEIKHIWEDMMRREEDCPTIEYRALMRRDRKDALSALLGTELSDFEVIDSIVEDPRYLWFLEGFKVLFGKKYKQEFMNYRMVSRFIQDAPFRRICIRSRSPEDDFIEKTIDDPNEIYKEYLTLHAWIEKVDQKVKAYTMKMVSMEKEN